MTKETALLLAGAEPEPEETITLLEHDKDFAAWAHAIVQRMQQRGLEQVVFVELLDGAR